MYDFTGTFYKMKAITIPSPCGETVFIGKNSDLVIIAGPCAIESYDHSMKMAELIGKICDKYKTKWVFKACYDKDCRSSPNSFHGLGLEEGLRVLERVRTETGLSVTSDFPTQLGAPLPARFATWCKSRLIYADKHRFCALPQQPANQYISKKGNL